MKKVIRLFLKKSIVPVILLLCSHPSYAQQWAIVGNETQISSVASYYSTITVLDDQPYVSYVEGTSSGGVLKVKRKNSVTGLWEQMGSDLSANATYARIYSDKNNKLYVTFIDVTNGNKLAIVSFNNTTQLWEPLLPSNPYISTGTATHSISAFSSAPRSSLAFDSNNLPYVFYSERAVNGNAYVKRFIAGVWETLGNVSVEPLDTSIANNIAIDENDVPFVVYVKQANLTSTSGSIKVYRFNSVTNLWENVSPPSPVLPGSSTTGATTSVRHTGITIDSSGNPVVSYFNISSNNKSTIIRLNKATASWNWIGTTSARDASNNSLVNDNGGNVYNMFGDALINGGLANMVRVFKQSKGAASFTELKSSSSNRGIDSTGDNSTTARTISISDLNIAVGSDTSKPYIVYTKTNSGGSVRTPIVQMFVQPVVTKAITGISSTSATSGGDISFDGGSVITERGIVFGTTVNPTTANTKIIDASAGTGSYSSTLIGLSPATTYHVRAYYINATDTVYGNNVTFTTPGPDSNSVLLQDNGNTVVLDNGIVKATINKSNATVTSLIYNGIELISGGYNGGSIYWSWNMPNYQNPSGCTYTLTADPHGNNFNYAEVKLHMTWNGSASTAAMDVDIYYSLPKNASGLYASATLSHPAAYPLLQSGEWRMSSYPNPRFDWMSIDSLRNRIMPSRYDMTNALAVAGAPAEVTRLTTGVYNNYYECKYDYSADFGDIDVWGWSSTTDMVGLWVTAPSKEYYPGGPMKRELTAHATPVLLNMLGGTHYGMGDDKDVAAGEEWQKTFGPFLIYCNKVSAGTSNASSVLWENAKTQALTEQAAWPYTWYTNPSYVQESGRGTITGKLVITDKGNNITAANMWVGVTVQQSAGSNIANFQRWGKYYQWWVKTDAQGNFTIKHVLPGTYNLYAFGPASAGLMALSNYVTVTAASTIALGNVIWTPTRSATTVWEIGIPDRSAKEFKHGNDWWVANYYPSTKWAKFMDYTTEFPNDVNFTIGQSNIATDWNYVMPYDKNVQSTSPQWNVNFNLASGFSSGATASVYVGLAAHFNAALIMSVNGTNVTIPSTGMVANNTSNAMIRKGIHGAFGELRFDFPASYLHAGSNQISFTIRVAGGASSGEVMFDYLRMEADATIVAVNDVSVTAGLVKAFPSPFTGNLFNLQLNNLKRDVYRISVFDRTGQLVAQKMVQYNGGSAMEKIELNSNSSNGIYHVQVSGKHQSFALSVLKK